MDRERIGKCERERAGVCLTSESFAYFKQRALSNEIKRRLDSEWRAKENESNEERNEQTNEKKKTTENTRRAPSLILHDALIHVFQSHSTAAAADVDAVVVFFYLKTVVYFILLAFFHFLFFVSISPDFSNRIAKKYTQIYVYKYIVCITLAHHGRPIFFTTRGASSVHFHFRISSKCALFSSPFVCILLVFFFFFWLNTRARYPVTL